MSGVHTVNERKRNEAKIAELEAKIKRLTARGFEDLLDENARTRKALEAVIDLHDKYDGPHTYCRECGGLTPCDTMNAAEGKDT